MKPMTKEQLAKLLDGNEYLDEMTKALEQTARENRLLVLFGQSDDLLEMRGVIHDEDGAWGGAEFALLLPGEMFADDDEENTYHRAEEVMVMPISDETCNDDNPRLIRAEWCPTDADLSWRLTSNLPHATFTIYESGEPYCEGIVIDLDEVVPVKTA